MKLARFNTWDINEAAKNAEKVELEKKVMDYLKDELTKDKMSRSDMVKKCEKKFEGEKDLKKTINDVIDDITHEPLSKKMNVESESYWIGKGADKYSAAFYFIGDKAKDPAGKEKNVKRERPAPGPKKEKKEKVKRFDEFGKEVKDEKGAGLKRWREEQKKKKAQKEAKGEKSGYYYDEKSDDKGRRKYNYAKDSLVQLKSKLRDEKYKDEWNEIEREIGSRPKRK